MNSRSRRSFHRFRKSGRGKLRVIYSNYFLAWNTRETFTRSVVSDRSTYIMYKDICAGGCVSVYVYICVIKSRTRLLNCNRSSRKSYFSVSFETKRVTFTVKGTTCYPASWRRVRALTVTFIYLAAQQLGPLLQVLYIVTFSARTLAFKTSSDFLRKTYRRTNSPRYEITTNRRSVIGSPAYMIDPTRWYEVFSSSKNPRLVE